MYAICNVIYGYPLSDILMDDPEMPPEIKAELEKLVESNDEDDFLHKYYSGCANHTPCAVGIVCGEFDETQSTNLRDLYHSCNKNVSSAKIDDFADWWNSTELMSPELKTWLLDYYKDDPQLFFLWSTS
jgi:hypothetical protein